MRKKCATCGRVAEGDAEALAEVFYPRRKESGYTGWRPDCKECSTAKALGWRAKNPKKWAAIQARYRANRKEGPE